MSLRTIEYTVGKDSISPKAEQSAGLRGENLVTDVVFRVDEDLLADVGALEGETVFRVQTTDGAGGYHSSEFLILDNQNGTVTFPITEDISNAGGVAFLHLIVSKLISEKTEQILYSFPARLKFEDTFGGTASEKEYLENIGSALARSIKAEEQAESAALRAEEAATEAESAKSTAQSASIITIEQKNQAAKSAASAAEHASSAEEAVANAQSAAQRAAGSSASAQSAAQSAAASSATAEFASEAAKALAESAEVSAKAAKEASKVVLQPNSYYANAIKGSVRLDTASSSVREIILTDVSPIEHELNFRITSDIINVSGLTFLKSGKNLCPAPESGATTTEVFKLPYRSFANNQYTFSTNASGWYGIFWEGGKSANVPTTFHNGETFTLTSANDEITIEGSTKWLGDGYYVQIERGTAATDYEEYSELQTVTTNSDGTVDGLISVSPTTIIEGLPPDSIISCEYNVDTKMYIDNMIASLINS